MCHVKSSLGNEDENNLSASFVPFFDVVFIHFFCYWNFTKSGGCCSRSSYVRQSRESAESQKLLFAIN